jgi:spore maturation protein CgeB
MKIILVAPKSVSKNRFDFAFWNFYLPLLSLGHQVIFFDSAYKGDNELSEEIEKNKPDLLFCIMTGDVRYCPFEPWQTIINETNLGRTKTFNYYCDDTWRFEDFSSKTCNFFNYCSTPEKKYVEKYKKIGYDNILHSTWHANSDLYSNLKKENEHLLCFVGQRHSPERQEYINFLNDNNFSVFSPQDTSFEDMVFSYSNSLLGLNFSKNKGKTQIKGRIFEITAINSLLLTEYHDEIEEYFIENKEIIVFRDKFELLEKIKFLSKNINLVNKISLNGHKRFLKEHSSKVRLEKLLREIK